MPTRAKTINDIPDGDVFLILKPTSVHVPGDERSRTNPGHGYPAETIHSWNIWVYDGYEEWRANVKAMTLKGETFVPIQGRQPTITKEIAIEMAD